MGTLLFTSKEKGMTLNELITKEDLQEFKGELLKDIKLLLSPGMGESKKWFKSSEVRKMLGISPGTLQNLRVNGTLRYTKVGGTMFYKIEDIQKMLEKNQSEGGES
ncbi:helix-turn-helix domain-containing protein [Pedobacter sp. L105]|uniref:helix-turn-helix domain-containing protein n=1 Tax=Pedobacter sp. L105 TaxID=1641871 RepID=UPI0020B14CCE|nr:helix-turn-helix domain-containing protein [Pedobacter sp. L105]